MGTNGLILQEILFIYYVLTFLNSVMTQDNKILMN